MLSWSLSMLASVRAGFHMTIAVRLGRDLLASVPTWWMSGLGLRVSPRNRGVFSVLLVGGRGIPAIVRLSCALRAWGGRIPWGLLWDGGLGSAMSVTCCIGPGLHAYIILPILLG